MYQVNWKNPYGDNRGYWLKGNLHTHTREGSPDGKVSFQEVAALYTNGGYTFLSFSEHLKLLSREVESPIMMIPGLEWNARTDLFPDIGPEKHVGLYSLDPGILQTCLQERTLCGLMQARRVKLQDSEGAMGTQQELGSRHIAILNHPNWAVLDNPIWNSTAHWSYEELAELASLVDGMEIFNGVILRLQGSPFALDKWDYLLSHGFKLLGFASDDFHESSDFGKGWVMVKTPEKSLEGIFKSLKEGAFYCSTGVGFSDIQRWGDIVTVKTTEPALIRGIGRFGKILYETEGVVASFPIEGEEYAYLRIEALGKDGSAAWTQPFFKGR